MLATGGLIDMQPPQAVSKPVLAIGVSTNRRTHRRAPRSGDRDLTSMAEQATK